jgi:hypothetical protein
LLVDARCSSRAPYYITRRQERATLSLLRLCRAGHRGRNGSRARLGRYAPSSGNVMCAPAVTLGASSGRRLTCRRPGRGRGYRPIRRLLCKTLSRAKQRR